MNVLFVSNSTCCFFPDELYGMLTSAGFENVKLAVVYYSGCRIDQHYSWWKNGESNYQFRVYTDDRWAYFDNYSLESALAYCNWDIISFDNSAGTFSSRDVQTSLARAEPHFQYLLRDIRERHPDCRYFWHEVWANEIGYRLSFCMETMEQRTQVYHAKRGVMEIMRDTYGLEIAPTGDAWEKVRDLPLFTMPIAGTALERFSLCTRIRNGELMDDFTHDGDVGGGQYLNACVWFEVITGCSCKGNTFRPVYKYQDLDCSLTEEKIRLLQDAAHEAVEAVR